jgi:hypothetical protein
MLSDGTAADEEMTLLNFVLNKFNITDIAFKPYFDLIRAKNTNPLLALKAAANERGNIFKNQINKDKIEQTQSIAAASSWVDTFLNWVIALVTLVAIVLLGRRFFKGVAPPTIEAIEAQARLLRAQAMIKNATARSPNSWW